MKIKDAMEWIQLADEDLYSARILNDAPRKPFEIICYHCAQAIEKYLKAFLIYNDKIPEKTHNLRFLNDLCIDIDEEIRNITSLCDFINRFANDIRYPHKYEANDQDVQFSLNAVEKIMNLGSIATIKNEISNRNTDEEDIAKQPNNI
jgi:HEPN domain-containing protein